MNECIKLLSGNNNITHFSFFSSFERRRKRKMGNKQENLKISSIEKFKYLVFEPNIRI